MKALRVAIVGAGIGGLSTAVALRRRGIEVEVYEQAQALGEVGAGIALASNGWNLLQRAGALPGLEKYGSSNSQGYFHLRTDGSHVATLRPVGVPAEKRVIGIHRADLITVLADLLPQTVIKTGKRVAEVRQDSGQASILFEDGESASADLVIGADGIHSAVRKHVAEEEAPVFSGMVAYRALVPVTSDDDWVWGTSKMWIGEGKHFLAYPIRADKLINVVAFVPSVGEGRDSWSAPGDPAEMARAFSGWDPTVLQLIDRVTDTFKWGLFDRQPLDTWVNGRIGLLGDAAHAMLPHLGQGAAQTIEDGFALAAALEGRTSETAPAALQRYQELRYERATAVQQAARKAGQLFDSEETNELEVRDNQIRRMAPFYEWLGSHDADSLVAPRLAPR